MSSHAAGKLHCLCSLFVNLNRFTVSLQVIQQLKTTAAGLRQPDDLRRRRRARNKRQDCLFIMDKCFGVFSPRCRCFILLSLLEMEGGRVSRQLLSFFYHL